jgi:CheY-like chemotaxis protein/DNA-binding XRE family transcriptional regulator
MTKADVKKEFGATIRAHRLRLGISQERLAERAALHRTYVTDVERGARNLSLESISRLARALELSISSLFHPPLVRPRVERDNVPNKASILLVEDDLKDIELTLAAFKEARLSNTVHVVRDGAAALDFLFCEGTNANRENHPGSLIVLLDLHLPKLDGLEVLKRLRDDERTRSLQVVVLTNSRNNLDVRAALRMGAEAYIVKPLDFQAFTSIIPRLNFSWTLLRPPEQPRIGRARA